MPTLTAPPPSFSRSRRSGLSHSRSLSGPHDLARLLPAKGDPDYLWVLCEMVRADMELTWTEGRPRRLAEYQTDFPELFQDKPVLRAIANEEYHLRELHGEQPDPAEYARVFGVSLFDDEPPPPGLNDTIAGQVEVLSRDKAPVPAADEYLLSPTRFGELELEPVKAATFPAVGETFLGFRLVEELGRGAFARVYLARQIALADRAVALKITTRPTQEPDRLAKLQHTHIVPIFSVHEAGSLQAVCMPYLGRATLADTLNAMRKSGHCPQSGSQLFSTVQDVATVPDTSTDAPAPPNGLPAPRAVPDVSPQPVRDMLGRMSYLDAVAWVVARLAEGLAHAHRRGIRHYDLKPANVLLGDDGQPMLLDFNLAHDVAGGKREQLGGTVMYMAPEQLEEVRDQAPGRVSEQTDLYSLGVMFFELLTGRHPFPLTGRANKIAAALELRTAGPPSVREINRNVSPAIEAVVRKLLDPDPAKRYATAECLWTDLDRHAIHLPLLYTPEPSAREAFRKWRHRNPGVFRRLGLAAAVFGVILSGAWAYTAHQSHRTAQADDVTRRFRTELATLRVDLASPLDAASHVTGVAQTRDWLESFGVSEAGVRGWSTHPVMKRLSPEDRSALAADLGEAAALLALSERPADRPEADRPASAARAARWWAAAADCFRGQPLPAAIRDGRTEAAVRAGEPAPPEYDGPLDLDSPRAEFLAGVSYHVQGRVVDAAERFERVTHARADHFAGQFLYGHCLQDLYQPVRAQERFDMAKALSPADYRPALQRGISLMQAGNWAEAEKEFSAAITLAPARPDPYYQRAVLRARWKPAEALADLAKAGELGGGPSTWHLHVRATAHEQLAAHAANPADRQRETERARNDREELFRTEPKTAKDYAIRGYALIKTRPEESLAAFRKATEINGKDFITWYNQACVLINTFDDTDEAILALDRSVEANPQFALSIVNRALIHARLGNRDAAVRDVERALGVGTPHSSITYKAGCVYALTSRVEPNDADRALTLLRKAAKAGHHDLVASFDKDSDLSELSSRADFQELVRSIRTLGQ